MKAEPAATSTTPPMTRAVTPPGMPPPPVSGAPDGIAPAAPGVIGVLGVALAMPALATLSIAAAVVAVLRVQVIVTPIVVSWSFAGAMMVPDPGMASFIMPAAFQDDAVTGFMPVTMTDPLLAPVTPRVELSFQLPAPWALRAPSNCRDDVEDGMTVSFTCTVRPTVCDPLTVTMVWSETPFTVRGAAPCTEIVHENVPAAAVGAVVGAAFIAPVGALAAPVGAIGCGLANGPSPDPPPLDALAMPPRAMTPAPVRASTPAAQAPERFLIRGRITVAFPF